MIFQILLLVLLFALVVELALVFLWLDVLRRLLVGLLELNAASLTLLGWDKLGRREPVEYIRSHVLVHALTQVSSMLQSINKRLRLDRKQQGK